MKRAGWIFIVLALCIMVGCKEEQGKTGDRVSEADDVKMQIAEKQSGMFPKFSCGGATTVMLREDGTVWAWGRNNVGGLGNGTLKDSETPVRVLELTDIVDIVSGGAHRLALKKDGTVWGWGGNEYGALGTGTKFDNHIPVKIEGLKDIIHIAAGCCHSLALQKDGTVWVWGHNSNGQIGDGTTTDRLTPVKVEGLTGVKKLAAGRAHTLALKKDGTVWAWGRNEKGQLGDGTNEERLTPVQVVNTAGDGVLSGITFIEAGGSYVGNSVAITENRELLIWGDNDDSQIGDGEENKYKSKNIPHKITDVDNVVSAGVGGQFIVALKADGTVWAWGYNWDGQLGDGSDNEHRSKPVRVHGLTDITTISVGTSHTFATDREGNVWAWGDNYFNVLGDGNGSPPNTPIKVNREFFPNN